MSEKKKSPFFERVITLEQSLKERFGGLIESSAQYVGDLTIEVRPENIVEVCTALRDENPFAFSQLVDLCGVDYSAYGQSEWETETVVNEGFGRARTSPSESFSDERRFAVVYHLLSIKNNQRVRVKTFIDSESMLVDSVVDIWPAANWFERETFDLFGILFKDHPDLRRILTDYGFVGHPFRKDFPLSGQVEVRYDEEKQRVIYEPVSIVPRVLVPRVIRQDNRFMKDASDEEVKDA
jgi:NADH-quinone oxidoreductase subunit C